MSRREATLRVLRQALRGSINDASTATTSSSSFSVPLQRSCTQQGMMNTTHRFPSYRGFASSSSSSATPSTRGPVSYVSLGLTMATGAGIIYWYAQEKGKKLESASGKNAKVVGKATIGGPFQLLDTRGKPFTDKDLLGKFAVLYFGFTHCPDICPEELEKVSAAVDLAAKKTGAGEGLIPVFISIDPERDTVPLVRDYVVEFHPKMIGLTGSMEAVREAARAYRVYYTKATLGEITGGDESESDDKDGGKKKKGKKKAPPPADDYLLDHSIITYLVDPEGKFVTFYGKNYSEQEMGESMAQHVELWKQNHPEWLVG